MKKDKKSKKEVNLRVWAQDLEPSAMEQAVNLCALPFRAGPVALMPDAHTGYGMPIGGVLATKGVIIPNAVGVDIGCGMMAMNTEIPVDSVKESDLKEILGIIRDRVPVGFNSHKNPVHDNLMAPIGMDPTPNGPLVKLYEKARLQAGTLGGGNHFIELQASDEGVLWAMVHSGSRNIGKQTADYYNKVAKELNARWYSAVPERAELAFLPLDTKEGAMYFQDMDYCVAYARLNRRLIMVAVDDAIRHVTGINYSCRVPFSSVHNFARLENHFGQNVVVHRKGATPALEGERVVIPGSQGTKSYIGTGLGNPLSYNSCSHGAGRKMGRKEAQCTLKLEDEVAKMEGVIHAIRNTSDLDEAPGAYKDIDEVMEQQKDLVEIKTTLTPLAVVKG